MKLRRLLAVILSLLMLVFMAVPAVSGADEPPVCGVPYLTLLSELEATVDHAKKYATLDGVEYTEESLARMNEAINEAEAFLAMPDEGTEAQAYALIEELNLAVEGLEGDPVVPYADIPFTLVQERRIQWYEPELSNPLFLVKSPEEMDRIIDGAYGTADDECPKPVRDPKYNDEFFEENALVIGLYMFGSGSDRQSIEKLTVEGDTLTVHRVIYYPGVGTDDIQWRYALMEVKLSDVEGVVNLADSYTPVGMDWNEKIYGCWGDVNNDNAVNVKDATSVQKNEAEIHLLYSANLYLADANGDGDVNIKDATEIQKYSAGIVLHSHVGELTKVCMSVVHYETEGVLTELLKTIKEAERILMAPGSNYVHATSQRLSAEIDKAKALYDSGNPDYDQVVAQTQALKEAIEGLETPDLDTSELIPLMNEAQRLIDAGGYTDESLDKLIDAVFMGQGVCLYGQTQEEVAEAIEAIEQAMAALESLYGPEAEEIPFTVAQSCRVWSYGSSQTELYLVKSPEQMDEILDTIGGQNTAVYTKPVRDEKYNDEYFAEHSLIISLNTLDGNDWEEEIEAISVKDNDLIIRRNVYMVYPSDKLNNHQYILIEVNNSDIEGVTKLKNGNEYWTVLTEPAVNVEVPFEVLEQRRIEEFYPYENAIYLVNSPEEMDSVLTTIEEGSGYYKRPERDEIFNEAYFAEKSLIISLGFVGGGCCNQSIDNLIQNGDTLTLYRTVYKKALPTPDMNYQYVLLEVSNESIDGVSKIVEDVDVVVNGEDTKANDKESAENIKVFFTNTQGWENVYIHYWNETETTQWPGFEMEFVENNIYGQDVYCYEISADTTGIVFNDLHSPEQTVDVLTNIRDGWGFYPTTKAENGWLVETYEYIIPAPVPATGYVPAPPVDEPASIDETEIDFTVLQDSRVQGWGELYGDEGLEIYLAESADEMDEVLSHILGEVTDQWEPKPTRGEKFNDEYFVQNNVIVALVPLGSGSYSQEVQKLTVEGNVLTIYTNILVPSISTCDMNYRYLLIEVNPDDISEVDTFEYVCEEKWIDVEEVY